MEDKKLDFYQPILSVRRVTSTAVSTQSENKRTTDNSSPKVPPLPFYKSELKSGPVRNPGTVPFVWEKTPGRPKNERKALTVGLERPPIAPKLPPGRVSIIKQQDFAEGSKPTTITQSKTESVLSRSQCVSSLDKNVTKYESSKEKIEVEGSEQGDDAYMDALDTISRTESFLMNCSISGLSSLDSQDVKPSGTFSMDPETRDFMIGRFLPAAKAMASETPQHATWKQPVLQEQLRQVEKAVARDKRAPHNENKPNVVPCQSHDIGVEDSEDEAYNYDGSEISSARVCGLFPRFCLKSSFCLLNPVPGMSMQRRVPISSVRTVKAKPSYAGSCSDSEKEHAEDGAHEQRLLGGCRTDELHENKTAVKSESNQTAHKSDCKELYESPLNKRFQGNGTSNFQNESFLSLHEEKGFLGLSEETKNSRVNGSDLHRKSQTNFRELLVNESTKWESGSTSPVEKTVYVDSVHIVKSRNSNSSFPNMRGLSDNGEDNFGIIGKSSGMEKSSCGDPLPQDFKHFGVGDEKAEVQPESSDSFDAFFLSCSDIYNPDMQMEMMNDSKQSQDLNLDSATLIRPKVVDTKEVDLHSQQPVKSVDPEGPHGLTRDYVTLTSSKVADSWKISSENRQPKKSCTRVSSAGLTQDSVTFACSKVGEKINLESQRPKRSGEQESSHGSYPCLPLGPPLPKSPSESWLKRTLPTLSSRNLPSSSSLAMCISTRNQASKTTSLDSNWERLVKTSNTHIGHLRFSEELLAPIPEA
ncbi:hypothetical protein I3760_03G187700 [Carya illinoinensis]|nr:hypothetical protein I3760_03G187700 [Carya illinoinensis]KAG2717681.1 hypothetical protein I3760_03G187700 [Carya illinoinensis]KAG2717682.1 hypothetical protein I3760_03G187700 [Carya illinoinensis]KAG2717685.1 hypothetical protein I3760_03G187700 [Carya illinoinensis]